MSLAEDALAAIEMASDPDFDIARRISAASLARVMMSKSTRVSEKRIRFSDGSLLEAFSLGISLEDSYIYRASDEEGNFEKVGE